MVPTQVDTSRFDGIWEKVEGANMQPGSGGQQFEINGSEIIFLETGKTYKFDVDPSGKDVVAYVGTKTLKGSFVDDDGDGNADHLKWTNGSVWIKVKLEAVETAGGSY
jgi:hypothetical protein